MNEPHSYFLTSTVPFSKAVSISWDNRQDFVLACGNDRHLYAVFSILLLHDARHDMTIRNIISINDGFSKIGVHRLPQS